MCISRGKGEFMEQAILVHQQEIALDNGSYMKLNYYVTEYSKENYAFMYGIAIEKVGHPLEVETTGPISDAKEWVYKMCEYIAKNQVTPIGLTDVIDDLITEQKYDVKSKQ